MNDNQVGYITKIGGKKIIIIILKFPNLKIRPSSDPILVNPDCNQRLTLTVD